MSVRVPGFDPCPVAQGSSDYSKFISCPQVFVAEFTVQRPLSKMSRVQCSKLLNLSADTAVMIFMVNTYWLGSFWKLHIGQAVRGESNVVVMTG